jgi:hypothetical protein
MNVINYQDQTPQQPYQGNIVTIFVVKGYKSDKQKDLGIAIQIRKEHLVLRIGWEMKDVVAIGLPQQFRFCVLKDYEHKVTPKGSFYCLYVSNS